MCPEKKHCRNWDSCVAGIKSKQLLLSPGVGLGTGTVPGKDGFVHGSKVVGVRIWCW